MISKAAVKALIDKAEVSYRECWTTLAKLKNSEDMEGPEGAALFQATLEFQPTLARALYDLSEMYKKLHQERKNVVAKKANLTPEWFRHRLALIDKYQRAVKAVISIGKRLGDSFAWIFYESNRGHLYEHYERQGQLHAPPGIGGLGELKFIEGIRMVNGHLVIYHGITTFLRLGDVSYINLKDRSLAAIGELKTTKVAEGELEIRMDAVAPSREALSFLEIQEAARDNTDDPAPIPLPQKMKARLDKQVASMGGPFKPQAPSGRVDLEHVSRVTELGELCEEMKTYSFTYRKVGDGLLLFGIRTARRSLSSKLLGDVPPAWDKKLQSIKHESRRIVGQGFNDNEFWFGLLNDPGAEYQLTPGMVPLFWWPLNLGAIEDILFQDILVFYLYNPAHLAAKLRRTGFATVSIPGQRGFKVEKKLGNSVLNLEGLSYFTHSIIHELWDEDTVVDALSSMAKHMEHSNAPPYTKIQMNVQQHLGPKPT